MLPVKVSQVNRGEAGRCRAEDISEIFSGNVEFVLGIKVFNQDPDFFPLYSTIGSNVNFALDLHIDDCKVMSCAIFC